MRFYNPKGLSTQYLGTWDLGKNDYSTGFGKVYSYYERMPSGNSGASYSLASRGFRSPRTDAVGWEGLG